MRRTQITTRILTKAFVVWLGVVAAVPSISRGQLLDDANWFERPLGDGVVWRYYLFDDLFGAKQSISYLEIDLTNENVTLDFAYLPDSRARTSTFVPAQFPNAIGAVNGTFFDTSAGGGGHVTYLRVDGTEVPPGAPAATGFPSEAAVASDGAGNWSVIRRAGGGWSSMSGYDDIMANGPFLIENGVILYQHFANIGSFCISRHPRTVAGITADGKLILMTVDGRTEYAAGMSCEELALVLEELGVVDGLNYDGGGSTTMWAEGEPYDGVVNYPSDNSKFDHSGERACSNAIVVIAPDAAPEEWDGRLTSISYNESMDSGTTQEVVLQFTNIGTETWTSDKTHLVTSRDYYRTSEFATDTWTDPTIPAVMEPATVAPGQTASFTFELAAPEVLSISVYDEYFALVQDGIGGFGPPDSDAHFKLIVYPDDPVSGDTLIVESRSGGQNYFWYTDSGFADIGANCTAEGTTPNIGSRYGSTYRSIAGFKRATWEPSFPESGLYDVYVTWGEAANRRNPITYTVFHESGESTFLIDQTSIANEWIRLGTEPFEFAQGLSDGRVEMTNADIDVSGSMIASAVKFVLVSNTSALGGNAWGIR